MPTSSPSRRGQRQLGPLGVAFGDGADLAQDRAVEDGGHEAGADALDPVPPGGPPDSTALVAGSTADDAHVGLALRAGPAPTPVIVPPVPTPATKASGRAVAELGEDLRAGGAPVRVGVGRVVELLRHEGVRVLARELDRARSTAPSMTCAAGVRCSSAP